jgi:hypothetical protein
VMCSRNYLRLSRDGRKRDGRMTFLPVPFGASDDGQHIAHLVHRCTSPTSPRCNSAAQGLHAARMHECDIERQQQHATHALLFLLHRAQISSPSPIIACMRFCWVHLLSPEPALVSYQHLSSPSHPQMCRSRGCIEEEGWSKHSNSVHSTCTRGCIPRPKAFHWGAQIRGRSCLG